MSAGFKSVLSMMMGWWGAPYGLIVAQQTDDAVLRRNPTADDDVLRRNHTGADDALRLQPATADDGLRRW